MNRCAKPCRRQGRLSVSAACSYHSYALDPDVPALRMVSFLVSFTPVRGWPGEATPNAPPQGRTSTTSAGRAYEHLESVLVALPVTRGVRERWPSS